MKKKIILAINTVGVGEVFVALFYDGKIIKQKRRGRSDKLLIEVDGILKKNKVKPGEIGGVVVVSGPGSFTAVRQGVVAVNALGYLLGVPVAGVRLDEFKNNEELMKIGRARLERTRLGKSVLPFYGKEPNITKPKN